jgi:hypothetical protein
MINVQPPILERLEYRTVLARNICIPKKYFVSAFISIGICSCALKILTVTYLFQGDQDIYNIGFGFGGYIKSLSEHFSFASCAGQVCDYVTRMPFLPILVSALSHLSKNYIALAALKNITLSAAFFGSVWFLLKEFASKKTSITWLLCLATISLSPAVLKHAAMIEYEEGIITEAFAIWALSFYLLSKNTTHLNFKSDAVRMTYIILIISGLIAYLTKSSMIIIFIIGLYYTFLRSILARDWRLGVIIVCSLMITLSWGIHSYRNTGRFSLMSSWDGENMFKGNNDISSQIYPELSLDRAVDTDTIGLNSGAVINNPYASKTRADYEDEWLWNDYYKGLAVQWIIKNKESFVKFLIRKAGNFLFSIVPTPYEISRNQVQARYYIWKSYALSAWLKAGRVAEIALFILLIRNYFGGRLITLSNRILLSQAAYAFPCVIGFNYERHITVYLVLVLIGLGVILDKYSQKSFNTASPGVRRLLHLNSNN